MTSSKDITPDALLQLTSDTRQVLSRKCKTSSQKQFHAVIASGSLASSANQCHGTSRSAFWLPFDLFMEDSMDGSQVATTSAVEVLTGTSHSCALMIKSPFGEKRFVIVLPKYAIEVEAHCRFSEGSSGCQSNYMA